MFIVEGSRFYGQCNAGIRSVRNLRRGSKESKGLVDACMMYKGESAISSVTLVFVETFEIASNQKLRPIKHTVGRERLVNSVETRLIFRSIRAKRTNDADLHSLQR